MKMEKTEKKLTEMTKEELKLALEKVDKKIETGNSDIQKYTKRISNIKKMIKDSEKDRELINALIKNLEYEELINSSTNN